MCVWTVSNNIILEPMPQTGLHAVVDGVTGGRVEYITAAPQGLDNETEEKQQRGRPFGAIAVVGLGQMSSRHDGRRQKLFAINNVRKRPMKKTLQAEGGRPRGQQQTVAERMQRTYTTPSTIHSGVWQSPTVHFDCASIKTT